jgi:hypothetical protein
MAPVVSVNGEKHAAHVRRSSALALMSSTYGMLEPLVGNDPAGMMTRFARYRRQRTAAAGRIVVWDRRP